jgi:hypothetical protein
MGKVFSEDSILKFAESFAQCISDFTGAREMFMRSLPPKQQELFRMEFNRLKRPELPLQGPLSKEDPPYDFKK